MYDKIKQIFSSQNPSNSPQNGFDGDMMLPFVNQRIAASVGKGLSLKSSANEKPERENLLNVVSSKVTLEDKNAAALDNLLASQVSDKDAVDMGTNTTPIE